ncbi:sugar ABC transporter permease [Pilimelia terevasa]|uniref:Sugar ABC transporter permease n=1 Tax=Pilimelia terevasa TaxID=53372 RepID=A0A8J3FJD7_9ACTN|nr:carbohydrate ABC transporter permease [Pilimelia terevasa]GGK39153.1 sugar ABC transporter permease [Pilimelia terevasa]
MERHTTRGPAATRRAVAPVRRRRRPPPDIRRHAITAVLLAFGPPLLLLLSASLRPPGLPPPAAPPLLPTHVTLAAYAEALGIGGLGRAALNSLAVCLVAVPVSVLVAAWAGFATTRLPRRAAQGVVLLSLTALMVPATALLVPRFALYRALHLTDTLVPLMAPALIATSPLYPLVYYVAFRAVPADLYETARLAGFGPWRTWWRVAMPLVRPVTVALATFTFVLTWSNFLDPLLYVYDRDHFTLPVALRSLSTLDPTDFPVFLAGAVLATLPALLVFAAAQWYMRGRTGSSEGTVT